MPRYYFHYQDHLTSLDEDGLELADQNAARVQAVVAAAEMLKDLGGAFWDSPNWRFWVTDESGAEICALRIAPG
ncbi:hypothetical protein [Methylobacterium sp. WL7]|uniref:DUF6894 family protein n=1 Tax=Methylobacterium sp. WL7 TaxID=2603900 RepID=UPI0011CA7303|nr:hypothetical protein [Methylobacterium sp. WL7]TXN47640.1 hypothetical protein FV233_04030 [Methylobacterium sp. WL7]